MKVIVSVILLAILAWLVFSASDKGDGVTASAPSAQEAQIDSEALTQALDSIHQVEEEVVPDEAAIPEPEAEPVAEAQTNEKGENAVAVAVEEFAPLKGVDLEKPSAPKAEPTPAVSVDDIAAAVEQAETASTPSANTSGDNYLSALEDEASVTELAIRKINQAVSRIKSPTGNGNDDYMQGLEGEADETSVEDVYVAGGIQPTEDFKEKVEGAGNVYRVKKGDSLSLIAAQYYGDALMYHKIFAANKSTMDNPDFLAIGQKLVIPPAD